MTTNTKKVKAIYPLTPMQEGMLFHTLYEPEGGMYIEQVSCRLKGEVQAEEMERAWQAVVERHEALRSRFAWKGLEKPVQVVEGEVQLRLEREDWRGLDEAEQKVRLEEYLGKKREEGFDLSRSPLMRLALLQMKDEEHVLVWSFHHLLMDGWSLPIVLEEVFGRYQGKETGKEAGEPGAYRDYVRWLQKQDMGKAEKFWRERLKGFRRPTVIGVEEQRGEENRNESSAGERSGVELSAEVTRELERWARQHQLTLNTLVQGAWSVLLSRYSGERDVVFGGTVSGRPGEIKGIEKMVGLFINTLPVRVEVKGEERVGEWLKRIQEQQVEQGQYEYSPLAEVQRWSAVESGAGLFEILMIFENYPVEETLGQKIGGSGLQIEEVKWQEQTNYPLVLTAGPGARLSLRLEYDGRRYEEKMIERMLGHLKNLLEQMAEGGAEQRVSELSLLTEQEREQLLVEWNRTKQEYPASCMQELFEEQVRLRPEAIALVWGERELSYGELNCRANQMAHYLRGKGVGPEVLVGILMERGLEMVVGLLGVMKAGGAYVPLDPEYPGERLGYMLEDSGAPVLLTQEKLKMRVPEYGGVVVAVDGQWEQIAGESSENPEKAGGADSLIYVIYTSGSTGKPKGVGIEHGNVVNFCTAMDSFAAERGRKHWLAVTSISFDISFFELLWTLARGFCVELAEPRKLLDAPQEQGKKTVVQEPTHLQCTPSTASMFLESAATKELLCSVENLFLGGEMLPASTVQELRKVSSARICNMYGPTETTIWSSVYELPEHVKSSIPIGKPIGNTEIYILDGDLAPVPVGVGGELYIGGAGVGRGYVNKPEATAERFIADPFSPGGGERLYRTGDLARYLEDGNIEYLGRVDHQVKVRGHRIELGEIEAVLGERAEVRQCVVVAQGTTGWEKQLVGYVVTDGVEIDRGELRTYLQQRLPEYMVPGIFVRLAALPLTPNGKVDRKRLPAPEKGRREQEREYVGPRNQVEEKLCAIWSQLLGMERVGIHDNFFELGGDSILSIQLVARANRAGLDLLPRHVFEMQTVAEQAAIAGDSVGILTGEDVVTGTAPLTAIQRRFFELDVTERNHYNQAVMLRANQRLDQELVERAIEGLLQHHDALRMRFKQEQGQWIQENAPEEDIKRVFVPVDLRGVAEDRRREEMETIANQWQRSLDLENGPVMRAAFFDLDEHEPQRLLLISHHLVVDPVSWRILLEDLERAYHQLQRGAAPHLGSKTTSYLAWARSVENHVKSGAVEEELPYWIGVLEHPSNPILPVGGARRNTVESAAMVTAALSEEQTRVLLRELPAENIRIQEVLLAALALTLREYTGEENIHITLEGHGREEIATGVNVSRTVGWFTSIFPVRINLAGMEETGMILNQVKDHLQTVPRRGIGYGLLRYVHPEKDVAGRLRKLREPEVSLNYLGQFDQTLQDGLFQMTSESTGAQHSASTVRDHVFDVNAAVFQNRLQCNWVYSSNFHKQETAQAMLESFLRNIEVFLPQNSPVSLSAVVQVDQVNLQAN